MVDMIKYKQTAVEVGRVVVLSIKTIYRAIRDHPFLVAFLLFLYLLHNYFPALFGFLVQSSPVILCTTLLLGTLLSYGDPIIPEIEEEEEEEKSTHGVSALQVHGIVDDLVIKKDDTVFSEIHPREQIMEDHIEPSLQVEASKDASVVERDGFKSQDRIFADVPGDMGGMKKDGNLMGSSSAEEQQLEMTRKGQVADGIRQNDSLNEGVHLDLDELKQNSLFYSLKTPLERRLGDFSGSDSDGAESSSPDASMADIRPVLDELHPLLNSELSRPIHVNIDDSDETTEVSSEGQGSDDSSEEDDVEDQEGTEEVKDGDDQAAIAWTVDDLENVMELGSIELERNQRLENMIAKRRARRNLEAGNLMGLDQATLDRYSRLKISSISTRRVNPFDYLNDSEENKGFPPIPGSAPSVLFKNRNPFEFPFQCADDINVDSTESTSRLPFMPGRNYPSEEKEDSETDPSFVPEKIVTDQASYAQFKRQLSEMRDYNLSNIPEYESVSVADEEYQERCDEHEISPSCRHEKFPNSSAVDRSSSEDFALEESDERQEEDSIPYSSLPQDETPSTDYTLLEPLISPGKGDLQQNISEMYSRQRSTKQKQVFIQIDENMEEDSEDDEGDYSEHGDLTLESQETSMDELVIPDYLTYGTSQNVQPPLGESVFQPSDVGFKEAQMIEETNMAFTDAAQKQLIINKEAAEDTEGNETTMDGVNNELGDVEESILSELDAVGDFSVQHQSLDMSPSGRMLLRAHSHSDEDASGSIILPSFVEDHSRSFEMTMASEKTVASELVEGSITAEREASIWSTVSLSDMQEVEVRSVGDLHVLKQLTEAGADSPRNISEPSPVSHGIHLQSLDDQDAELDKEDRISSTNYAEEADGRLEEQLVLGREGEQIAENMHLEKTELHSDLHEVEAKPVEDMHFDTKQYSSVVPDDDQKGIEVEPIKEQKEHNMGIESKIEPNVEIQSDVHEIEAETLEDIDLALKRLFRQNTLILERGNGSKDMPPELSESEKVIEPGLEVQSNLHEVEAQSLEEEAKDMSSELSASDKEIETKLDVHLNMHEVEVSSYEDLDSLKTTSEGSVNYPERHEGSSSESEQTENDSLKPKSEGSVNYPERHEGSSSEPEQTENDSLKPKSEGSVNYPERHEGSSSESEQTENDSLKPKSEGSVNYPERHEGSSSEPEQTENDSLKPKLEGSVDYPERHEGSSSEPEQTENDSLKPKSEGSVNYPERHEGSSSEPEQTEKRIESDEKMQSNLHEVEAKSIEDINSALKRIYEGDVDVADKVIKEKTEKHMVNVLEEDEKNAVVTSQPEVFAVESVENVSSSN